MIRGDICWHTFKYPDKRRPILILTRDVLIPELNDITAAPITTTVRDESTQVLLDESDGMFEMCPVNLVNIQTISKEKISDISHIFRMKECRKFLRRSSSRSDLINKVCAFDN